MANERSQMLPWVSWLSEAGFNLLLFDLRGCGVSDGATCTIGMHERLDLIGAVDYLFGRPDCQSLPIGVLGYSFGGVVSLQAAAEDERIAFAVSHGAYADLSTAVDDRCRHHFGKHGELVAPWALRYGQKWAPGYEEIIDPVDVVHLIAPRPLLIINGCLDTIVPNSHAERMFAAAGEPKSLVVLPSTRHSYPSEKDEPTYREAVLRITQFASLAFPVAAFLSAHRQ